MDNKQAIKNIKEHCYFSNLTPSAKQALDKAIASLEAWDKVKEQILDEKELYVEDELPLNKFRFGMERTIEIINEHLGE